MSADLCSYALKVVRYWATSSLLVVSLALPELSARSGSDMATYFQATNMVNSFITAILVNSRILS